MAERGKKSWSAPGVELPVSKRLLTAERQLALVDRVLGLEAQVAELGAVTTLTPTEQLRAEQQLQRLRDSPAWRIGRAATLPARVARRAIGRVTHR
ncbi:MAG: hypothetical protein ABI310_08105 [Microbacteriaceae bacterium]